MMKWLASFFNRKGIKETSIASISGQSVCLELTKRGDDIEGRLARAQLKVYSPAATGINVRRVIRDELHDLAEYMRETPKYSPMVDGIPIPLKVKHFDLVSYSLIISKVVDEKVFMHGIKDGNEPRNGNDIYWNKIKQDDARGCYDEWNMGSGTITLETSIACISGQSVSLELTERSDDLKRQRLAEAKSFEKNPAAGLFNVLRVDRRRLVDLGDGVDHAPEYSLMVDGNPTALKVKQYDLLHCSLIILKVVKREIFMHRTKNGNEPRNGKDIDWKKIREDDAHGCYDWKMGSGTIASKPGASSSRQPKTRG